MERETKAALIAMGVELLFLALLAVATLFGLPVEATVALGLTSACIFLFVLPLVI